jgi:hypothetical protein
MNLVSLSSPYWFIWWIAIGMGYVMFAGNLGMSGILAFLSATFSPTLFGKALSHMASSSAAAM